MTDANFKNAGYALMIEENAEEKITSVKIPYAPVALGSKMFSPSQIKMSSGREMGRPWSRQWLETRKVNTPQAIT